MQRVLKQQFCNSKPFSVKGAFDSFVSAVKAPVKHFRYVTSQNDGHWYQNHQPNLTNEAFGDVANEWKAVITQNPYDVNIWSFLEQSQTQNFGTLDNPLVVFTSDTSFRYVGCTGQTNEDDYEGHELFMFMLREGPLQRCTTCGQVFKLVRLRNEFSEEMDYYISNQHPLQDKEMGEWDGNNFNWRNIMMTEPTNFATQTNTVYSMVNKDDHDRLLTDPAYRFKKLKDAQTASGAFFQTIQEMGEEEEIQKFWNTKTDYNNLYETELAIAKLDRKMRKANKYNSRELLDYSNHERREARMQERQQERNLDGVTIFTGDLTAEEQQYKDYFETDLELEPENEGLETYQDSLNLLEQPYYKLKNQDFQQGYTRSFEDDQSSVLSKMAFRFKFRQADDSSEVFFLRNKRMLERYGERAYDQKFNNLISNLAKDQNNPQYQNEYINYVTQEAIQQYKDYYEDDIQQDFSLFNGMSNESKVEFAAVFESYMMQIEKDQRSGIKYDAPYSDEASWLQNQFWSNLVLFSQYNKNSRLLQYYNLQNLSQKTAVENKGKEISAEEQKVQLQKGPQYDEGSLLSIIKEGMEAQNVSQDQINQVLNQNYFYETNIATSEESDQNQKDMINSLKEQIKEINELTQENVKQIQPEVQKKVEQVKVEAQKQVEQKVDNKVKTNEGGTKKRKKKSTTSDSE